MKIFVIFLLFFSFSINFNEKDPSLVFETDARGNVHLYSLDSALRIKITKCTLKEDTLFIKYKKGLFVKGNSLLPLSDNVKYIVCAGNIYKVTNCSNFYTLSKERPYKDGY